MRKKVLIISTSLRTGSNSDILAKEFERGAKDAGHEVEYISLKDKNISFCKGCLACQKTGKCVINDDAVWIAEKVKESEIIVYATPIYYYGMSGQMKALLDRMNSLYSSKYSFSNIYLIATAAEDEENTMDKTIIGLQGWIDCFDNVKLSGVIRGGGVNDSGEANNRVELLKEAYSKGRCL